MPLTYEERKALQDTRLLVEELATRLAGLVRGLADDERALTKQSARVEKLVDAVNALTQAITRPNLEQLRAMGWAAEGFGPAPVVPVRRDNSSSFVRATGSNPIQVENEEETPELTPAQKHWLWQKIKKHWVTPAFVAGFELLHQGIAYLWQVLKHVPLH